MICNAGTDWKFEWRRDGEIVTCPWHGLEFDLTTGRCLAPKEFQVRQFEVRVVDGELRVSLTKRTSSEPPAPPPPEPNS
jgi:hypothetical protein